MTSSSFLSKKAAEGNAGTLGGSETSPLVVISTSGAELDCDGPDGLSPVTGGWDPWPLSMGTDPIKIKAFNQMNGVLIYLRTSETPKL